jgi:hypothetical protein
VFAESPPTPISITSDTNVYEKNQTIIISINNEDSSKNAIFNFEILDPNGKIFKEDCIFHENPQGDIIQPFSTVEITWNTKDCKNKVIEGNWKIISHLTSEKKLTDLTTSVEIKIVEDIVKYNSQFLKVKPARSSNEIIFENNPKRGVFKVAFNNKTLDVPYEIFSGDVSYLDVGVDSVHFKLDSYQQNVTLNVKMPSAFKKTDSSCFYGEPGAVLSPKTEYGNFELKVPTERKKLGNSSFVDILIYYSGNPMDISVQSFFAVNMEPLHPWQCEKPLEWAKSDASLWSGGVLSDSHFASMIQLLIEHDYVDGSVKIGNPENPFTRNIADKITELPQWLKISAEWWSEGLVEDDEMMNSIEYLIETKIIKF